MKNNSEKTGKHKRGSRRKAALIMSLFIFMSLLTACTAAEVKEHISGAVTKFYRFMDDLVDSAEEKISSLTGGETASEEEVSESESPLSVEDWLREHPDSTPEDYAELYGSEESSEEEESSKSSEESTGEALNYAYTTLSDEEKKVYQEIYDCLDTMSENVKLSTTNSEVLDKCFNYCIMDHPELFYTNGYKATVKSLGDVTVALSITGRYTMSAQKRKEYQERIEKIADDILSDAPIDDNDYEKVKYCFDHIIKNTTYNVNAADNQNIISVFINGESVCQGYTLAMKYLLDRLGVECGVVYGSANGSNHSWNIVKIDGTWTYVDVTWGDASYRNYVNTETIDEINYNYFGCNNEILRATHKIDSPQTLPNCTSLESYYYVKEGVYFKSADIERLKAVFKLKISREEDFFMIRCDSEDTYTEFIEELFDKKRIFDVYNGARRVTYATDEVEKTISFWME